MHGSRQKINFAASIYGRWVRLCLFPTFCCNQLRSEGYFYAMTKIILDNRKWLAYNEHCRVIY